MLPGIKARAEQATTAPQVTIPAAAPVIACERHQAGREAWRGRMRGGRRAHPVEEASVAKPG